ncbi:FAD-dependent oxidoreductase [Pseudonocardia nematodicida]|uniref:FAD-dependent oxidoreductase n=1 Tax=Pseudonocardia nematodicida TaxID=1206997 RepID=A0ABV1KE13_9PSEU
MPQPPEHEVDLVVVGAGSAGAAAAIAAHDAGLDVCLLEKAGSAGGNSRYSAGNLLELTGPDALAHLVALCFGRTPERVLTAYLEHLAPLRGRLEALGARTRTTGPGPGGVANCWPNLPGSDGVRFYTVEGPEGPGPALWRVLASALDARGVHPVPDARVTALVRDGGRVVGVRARVGGIERVVAARAGVVLATGGFQGDPALCETYLPVGAAVGVSHPEDTGDGLRLAQEAGAALWHMSNSFGFWSHRAPGQPVAYPIMPTHPAHLIVDGGGHRLLAETGRETHDRLRLHGDFRPDRPNVPRLPLYLVFGGDLLRSGPLSPTRSPNPHPWSTDNGAELAAGWIRRADDLADLAAQLDLPAGTLAATVRAYDGYAARGADPEFARPAASMRPLGAGPYHAVPVEPGLATTAGGPRRDERARVLDHDGAAVPGLYAIGDNGSIWGHLIQHGCALTDGLVFGPVAVADAVASQVPSTRTGAPSNQDTTSATASPWKTDITSAVT